jgi:hypothetical protein
MLRFTRYVVAFPVLAIAMLGSACSTPVGPDDEPGPIEPIQITKVDVLLLESFPVQGMAHVEGIIGDACSTLLPIEQSRSGSTITISIRMQRLPAGALCVQVAKLYDETISLGTLSTGEYALRVNDVEEEFRVD